MNNIQVASLVLNTVNGATNNVTDTSFTWYNINLRTLLGDMYDKYDMFNLSLDTVTSAPSFSIVYKSPIDSLVNLRISGLPFINNTYNVGANSNGNTNTCTIGSFQFGLNSNVLHSAVRFTGSIGANGATLTLVSTGIVLPIGQYLQFYDPNTNAIAYRTVIAQINNTSFTLSSPIGATPVPNTTYFATITYTTSNQLYNGSNIATFGKNQDLCNITIDYLRVLDLLPPEVLGDLTFPSVNFIFHIYGIEKDKGNLNGSRIELK